MLPEKPKKKKEFSELPHKPLELHPCEIPGTFEYYVMMFGLEEYVEDWEEERARFKERYPNDSL